MESCIWMLQFALVSGCFWSFDPINGGFERGHPSLLRPAFCRLLKHDHLARSLLTESFTLTLQFATFTPTSLNSIAIYDFFQAPFLGFSLREPAAPSWNFNSASTGRIYHIYNSTNPRGVGIRFRWMFLNLLDPAEPTLWHGPSGESDLRWDVLMLLAQEALERSHTLRG